MKERARTRKRLKMRVGNEREKTARTLQRKKRNRVNRYTSKKQEGKKRREGERYKNNERKVP